MFDWIIKLNLYIIFEINYMIYFSLIIISNFLWYYVYKVSIVILKVDEKNVL